MAVARDRHRPRPQPEAFAGEPEPTSGSPPPYVPTAPALADVHALERPEHPLAVPLELERPPRELGSEGDRLGMNAVCATGHDRVAMLLRAADHRLPCAIHPREDECAGLAHLEQGGGVEHIRRRQPVMEPTAGRTETLGHRVDEGGEVVLRSLLELGHALGRGNDGAIPSLRGRLAGHGSKLGPRVGSQLHFEQAREPALLRPDALHGRSGVAGDHAA